ncbi:MAG: hypothetical protein H6922_06130 [Pseudomonadaceae bacterium]|nr:hypothetical protein [Pseudomonadaceae bacterium]
MGSLFSAPKIPAPPPPPPPSTVRDEINNVEQVPVTNADGSVTYITRALPLSAEDQAKKDELDGIMKDALAEIQKLSAADYADDAETKRVLDLWQTKQEELVGKGFEARGKAEEESLARRGLSDSSSALAVRRQRQLDLQDAKQNVELGREALSDNVRGERLGLQQNLYNIAAGASDTATARQFESAVKGQSAVAAINAQRSASLLDYYDRTAASQSGRSPFASAFGGGLGGSLGRTVGGGGPFGVVGGFLGSLFGNK